MKTILLMLFAAVLLKSSASYPQTGYPGDIGVVRDLPLDWWGLNSHDSISLSCPSVDGIAVFKARPLYTMLVDSIVYFDDSLCSVISEKGSAGEAEGTLTCYPNPTSNFTLIDIGEVHDVLQELIVYDFVGQEHMRIMLPLGIRFYSLHFDQATQGIYHIQLLRDNVSVAHCTLVLIQ